MIEREFFDDDEPSEEETNAMQAHLEDEAEAAAVAKVAAELKPEPAPVPAVPIPLALHVESAAAGGIGGYPTEDPGDDITIWCPTPNMIGSHRQGFRKIK